MWAAELACALRVVHGANVLHRDLKSENIFLTAAAHIKLGDFGLSRNINEDGFATTTCAHANAPLPAPPACSAVRQRHGVHQLSSVAATCPAAVAGVARPITWRPSR
eukprot:71907-Prymnesium_polylepis.1